jgi:uncharacterized protein (TIGR00297 family)
VNAIDTVAALGAVGALILAWRFRWLTQPALLMAAAIGAAVWAGAGTPYVILLFVFFATSSALSHSLDVSGPGETSPRSSQAGGRRPQGVRGGRTGRSAFQVLANGGVAAVASLAGLAGLLSGAQFAVAGALAAAMADTWATEIGTAAARPTRLITSGEQVPPGSSGGVSWPGTAAAFAATAVLGLTAAALTGDPSAISWLAIMIAAGMFGMAVDSIMGATLEDRVSWVDNQVVNMCGSSGGALAALAIGRAIGMA